MNLIAHIAKIVARVLRRRFQRKIEHLRGEIDLDLEEGAEQ